MITPEQISYELEIQENMTIKDLEDAYKGNIIIWITGSVDSVTKNGTYYGVLQYQQHKLFFEKELVNTTANRAMIMGVIDAVKRINRLSRICVITATSLGFKNAFKGKGPNAAELMTLFEDISSKKCKLTEVQFLNGAALIKNHIYESYPDENRKKQLFQKEENKKEKTKEYYNHWVYQKCVDDVVKILEANQVSISVIEQIKALKENGI
ncbi:MAG: hypothetical protein IJX63_11955 [Lachnospiraceae bacterium]|nr:hypothetical protein [Lachnospiraceae bacterium]